MSEDEARMAEHLTLEAIGFLFMLQTFACCGYAWRDALLSAAFGSLVLSLYRRKVSGTP